VSDWTNQSTNQTNNTHTLKVMNTPAQTTPAAAALNMFLTGTAARLETLTTAADKLQTIADLAANSDNLTEFIDGEEPSDIAHRTADSSADVIYYGKAIALVNDASGNEVSEAESTAGDCSSNGKPFADCDTFGEVCTQLAYWITYNRTIEEIQEGLEKLQQGAQTAQTDAEEIQDELEHLQTILADHEGDEATTAQAAELEDQQEALDAKLEEVVEILGALEEALEDIDSRS
tara:strand:+ start:586 stop:1284 length:699 start_codon:yes stop_codon:yes gene_type:complete